MKNIFSFFIVFLISLSCSYVFAAKQGGTLTFARYQEPLTLDPFIPADNGSIWALEQVCDSLTEPGRTGNELVAGLAKSWDISDDGLTYTFHIRDAVHSNGDAVTAQDRPYRPPMEDGRACKILLEEADNGKLDKELVKLFINHELWKSNKN